MRTLSRNSVRAPGVVNSIKWAFPLPGVQLRAQLVVSVSQVAGTGLGGQVCAQVFPLQHPWSRVCPGGCLRMGSLGAWGFGLTAHLVRPWVFWKCPTEGKAS